MCSISRRVAGALLAAVLLCAAVRPSLACDGDCRGEGAVTIDDLIRAVNIALGTAPVSSCTFADRNGDGAVTIEELVSCVQHALAGCAVGAAGEVLINVHGGQLDEYDLGTGATTTIVPSTHAVVVGQACLLPDGSGQFAVGDITATFKEPALPPAWGLFSPDGTFLKPLPFLAPETPPNQVGQPVGCAVDAAGRLFGVTGSTLEPSGRLVVFFPPDYATSCVLDDTLSFPSQLAVDDAGDVYTSALQLTAEKPAQVLRFAPPFPTSAAECGNVTPSKSVFVEYGQSDVSTGALARRSDGHWFVVVNKAPVQGGTIRELAADGTFVRDLFPLGSGGAPVALAFDSAGTLFYSDLTTTGAGEDQTTGWTLRRIVFDSSGEPSAPEPFARGTGTASGLAVFPSRADEWLTLGGSLRRTYFNPRDRQINVDTVPNLKLKWRYLTSGLISAQPAVVWLDLAEGRTQVVIIPSWDGHLYALRAENGSRVWQYEMKRQPGAYYPYTSSPTVAWIDGQPRVFVGGGETLYCIDAATGAEIWQFDAGTGCTTCTARQERNEIEATPAVVNGLVIASMDTNDGSPGKGGIFALRVDDGRLVWWFDLFTEGTCRPLPEDNVRHFDGFHSAEQLGLPDDFFGTRPGCDFDRASTGCGNVWSSPAVDARRGVFYTVSGNCDTDDDPQTPAPPLPLPRFEEAIFAVTLNGDPVWAWRPREVDPDDLDFGAVPNLFEAEIGGAVRDLVGVGGKDGTFYVLDRDGTNALTSTLEPYWRTNVVPGGFAGGFIGAASVGEGLIVSSTAAGEDPLNPQRPTVHAFDAATGEIVWQYSDIDAAFAPAMGVPGLAIVGGTPRPNLNFFTRDGGELLRQLRASTVPGGVACGATVVGPLIFVGGGTGAFNSGSQAEGEARRDTPLSAFCVVGTPGCEPDSCDDGQTCTYDYRDRTGTCVSEPSADGIDCMAGTTPGHCQDGTCMALAATPTPTS